MTGNGGARREGKVAQFLNERQIVINIGARDGVKTGMRFAVLSEIPREVRDPDTQEILGLVDLEKVKVEAVEVQDRLTICETYDTYRTGLALWELLSRPSSEEPVTRKIEDSTISRPEDNYVKIGDRVRELVRDPVALRSSSARN